MEALEFDRVRHNTTNLRTGIEKMFRRATVVTRFVAIVGEKGVDRENHVIILQDLADIKGLDPASGAGVRTRVTIAWARARAGRFEGRMIADRGKERSHVGDANETKGTTNVVNELSGLVVERNGGVQGQVARKSKEVGLDSHIKYGMHALKEGLNEVAIGIEDSFEATNMEIIEPTVHVFREGMVFTLRGHGRGGQLMSQSRMSSSESKATKDGVAAVFREKMFHRGSVRKISGFAKEGLAKSAIISLPTINAVAGKIHMPNTAIMGDGHGMDWRDVDVGSHAVAAYVVEKAEDLSFGGFGRQLRETIEELLEGKIIGAEDSILNCA